MELEAVLQSKEDEEMARGLSGMGVNSSATKRRPPSHSYTALYNSINNARMHSQQQQRRVEKLMRRVERLGLDGDDYGGDGEEEENGRVTSRGKKLLASSGISALRSSSPFGSIGRTPAPSKGWGTNPRPPSSAVSPH
jgi:hypothetical protein